MVLLNSAGLMEKGYQPPAQEKAAFAPPFFVANAASQVGKLCGVPWTDLVAVVASLACHPFVRVVGWEAAQSWQAKLLKALLASQGVLLPR